MSLPLSNTSRFLGSFSKIQELFVNEGDIKNEDGVLEPRDFGSQLCAAKNGLGNPGGLTTPF